MRTTVINFLREQHEIEVLGEKDVQRTTEEEENLTMK